ncbi:MAG: alpha/beta fold hydrolase, partial [Solirubrobacteraceae bacterium]
MASAQTTSNTMSVCYRTVDGVRIRCAESDGPPDRTVVLTSPWPESVYAFAPIWTMLGRRFRLFAVDLPGFGASERRSDLLSPRAMGAFLVRVVDECELGRPHLVAPD